jgi:hypothetical protein
MVIEIKAVRSGSVHILLRILVNNISKKHRIKVKIKVSFIMYKFVTLIVG